VIEDCEVLSVESIPDPKAFSVGVSEKGSAKLYLSKQVVVASGSQNKKNVPSFAKNISPDILQLHAGEYRNAHMLPEGAVLVIGSAQSGVQIAEDLIASKEKFHFDKHGWQGSKKVPWQRHCRLAHTYRIL